LCISHLSHPCYMSHASHSPLFDHPDDDDDDDDNNMEYEMLRHAGNHRDHCNCN
jgi:hypothetical protein